MSDQCLFCDAEATHYCDAGIGIVYGETVNLRGHAPYLATTMDAMLGTNWTCSAPCCATHAHKVGNICGSVTDTIDHCSGCIAAGRGGGGTGVMMREQIEAIRRQWHAEYRRGRLALVEQP